MPQCCAINCKTAQTKGKLFHRIPSAVRNAERRKIWVQMIGRPNWQPSNGSRLCEDHFMPDQYENGRKDGAKKLRPNAIPTVFSYKQTRKPTLQVLQTALNRPQPLKTSQIENNVTNTEPSASNDLPKEYLSESRSVPPYEIQSSTLELPTSEDLAPESSDIVESTTRQNLPMVWISDRPTGESNQPAPVFLLSLAPQESSNPVTHLPKPNTDREVIQTLRRKLDLAQKKVRKLQKELEYVKSQAKSHFSEDQIRFFSNGGMRGSSWSENTLRNALDLRKSCGANGYRVLRSQGYPLPSERTLRIPLRVFSHFFLVL